ncbi:hypothetical protein AYI70_g901 [Smittium culicis]|uniref:Uncharacterized protein n=1 Tax=Smittium culicis TaxID=133412 RepID=A0A1R1YEW0_9FUNG|nr:hypothetical protein AYI70_g9570 [Smittium culicis]OMJ25423.1 hypothetical protein AYI70_g901 [Smittium culicis]
MQILMPYFSPSYSIPSYSIPSYSISSYSIPSYSIPSYTYLCLLLIIDILLILAYKYINALLAEIGQLLFCWTKSITFSIHCSFFQSQTPIDQNNLNKPDPPIAYTMLI